MRPILSKSSEELIAAVKPWGEYYATVFDRVPGTQMEDIDLDETILFQYGKALGLLHRLSSMYIPTNRRWSYEDVLIWMNGDLAELQTEDAAHIELDLLQEYFSESLKPPIIMGWYIMTLSLIIFFMIKRRILVVLLTLMMPCITGM